MVGDNLKTKIPLIIASILLTILKRKKKKIQISPSPLHPLNCSLPLWLLTRFLSNLSQTLSWGAHLSKPKETTATMTYPFLILFFFSCHIDPKKWRRRRSNSGEVDSKMVTSLLEIIEPIQPRRPNSIETHRVLK